MTFRKVLQGSLVVLAVVGSCLPQSLLSAELKAGSMDVVNDVALLEGGVLVGQVVDSQGLPLSNVSVSVKQGAMVRAMATTNEKGVFQARGLQGGVYQVVAPGSRGVYRLWASGSAPPAAKQGMRLVNGGGAARGRGAMSVSSIFRDPLIMGGIVATAIAVPIAVHYSGRPSSP
jgi:hypothetical protein